MFTLILVFIVLAFFLGLLLKRFFPALCALCFSVSLLWLGGLAGDKLGLIIFDPVLLALLIGTSLTGISYYLFRSLRPNQKIFLLPFFLSALSVGAFLLDPAYLSSWKSFLILTALWLIALSFYLLREKAGVRKFFQTIIECCKNF